MVHASHYIGTQRLVAEVVMALQNVDFQTKQLQYKACIKYGEGNLQ